MGPPEMKYMTNKLHTVRVKWKTIGRQLRVSEDSLNSIASVHKGDLAEALAQMLRVCLKRSDPEFSWTDSVEALRMSC